MVTYALRRILQMIPVIIGTTFIIYALVFALGDPTVGRCGERPCPPAYIEAFEAEYNLELANPYLAAERGYIDAVISPHETRSEIVRSLRLLRNKRETLPPKKHGNIPL